MNEQFIHAWIAEMNGELSEMESIAEYELQPSRGRKNTIHRLPDYISEKLQPQYYRPLQVGFGPYHDRHEYFWQQHKRRILLYFLKRSNRPLDKYVEAMTQNLQHLKDVYNELSPRDWFHDDSHFFEMIFCDGCFLLETLRELKNLSEANYSGIDYNSDNPLWGIDLISRSKLAEDFKHDMLLLGNQLPLPLLVRLHAIQTDKTFGDALEDINTYMLWIFWPTLAKKRGGIKICDFRGLHLLDLYREQEVYSLWRDEKPMIGSKVNPEFNFNIPSATDLEDARIRITMSPMWISFERGNLRLPQICVNDETRSRFINMILLEHLGDNTMYKYKFTSYVYFMSGLIKGANDVSILKSCGIIRSSLNNNEVAEMFYSLTKDIIVWDPLALLFPECVDLSKQLMKSFNEKNKEWKKDLWQKYLRSPWAIASIAAAFLLFALAAVQTVYTVLGYYNSK